MAVFKEIMLPWEGEEVFVTPTMALLRRCEQKGMSLTRLMQSLQNGSPEIGSLTLLIAELLKEGGASASEDDVFAVLMGGDEGEIEALTVPAVMGFVYEPDEKKPKARKHKTHKTASGPKT